MLQTVTKFAFRRYKHSKLAVCHFRQNGSTIVLTSHRTSSSHQTFCPIKCSLEFEASAPYTINRRWSHGWNRSLVHSISIFRTVNAALRSSMALNDFSPSCDINKTLLAILKRGGTAWYVPPCLPVSVKMTSRQNNAACFKAFQWTFKICLQQNITTQMFEFVQRILWTTVLWT